MIEVIGIGESDIDIYLSVDNPPTRGGKVRAKELGKFPGGMIGNFCSGIAKNEISCGIVSIVGDDHYGKLIMDDYKKRNLDIEHITIKENGQTFYCVVHVDSSGEKYLTAVVTELLSPPIDSIDLSYISKAKYVHINSMDYTLAEFVCANIYNTNTKISLDYESHAEKHGYKDWKAIFEKINILFINENSIKSIFDGIKIEDIAKKLLELGIEIVVVTCATQGGFIFTNSRSYQYEALDIDGRVDTTGAGDCFNSYFLASFIKNKSIEYCMYYASAAASLSITKIGAREGLPTEKEIHDFIKNYKNDDIKKIFYGEI